MGQRAHLSALGRIEERASWLSSLEREKADDGHWAATFGPSDASRTVDELISC